MKTTKLISLLLSAVLLCTPLLSCGQENPEDATVPNGMQAILSEAGDYYLMVPSHWLPDETEGMTSAYAEDAARSSISVCANELTRDITSIEGYWELFTEQFRSTFPDFAMIDEVPEDVTVGSANEASATPGKKYRYTATVGGVRYQWMQILFIRGAVLYIMTYTSTPEAYEDGLSDVGDIIANFTFR